MNQRSVPVKGSVRTSKKTGKAHSVASHSRKVEGDKPAKDGVSRRTGPGGVDQLADAALDARDVRGHRLTVSSGKLAVFSPELVDRDTLESLVASGDALVIPVGPSARIEGRFDRSYGGDELCEVTVNGNDGYEVLGGVEVSSGQVVVCDPSLVFDDALYGEALTATGSRRGAGVVADGKGLCFTTYGNSECLADVFGDRGRFLIREDDGDDGVYEDLYDGVDDGGFGEDFY